MRVKTHVGSIGPLGYLSLNSALLTKYHFFTKFLQIHLSTNIAALLERDRQTAFNP